MIKYNLIHLLPIAKASLLPKYSGAICWGAIWIKTVQGPVNFIFSKFFSLTEAKYKIETILDGYCRSPNPNPSRYANFARKIYDISKLHGKILYDMICISCAIHDSQLSSPSSNELISSWNHPSRHQWQNFKAIFSKNSILRMLLRWHNIRTLVHWGEIMSAPRNDLLK